MSCPPLPPISHLYSNLISTESGILSLHVHTANATDGILIEFWHFKMTIGLSGCCCCGRNTSSWGLTNNKQTAIICPRPVSLFHFQVLEQAPIFTDKSQTCHSAPLCCPFTQPQRPFAPILHFTVLYLPSGILFQAGSRLGEFVYERMRICLNLASSIPPTLPTIYRLIYFQT